MKPKILVADLLCGAGGSSTGCMRALERLGLDMDLVCVNHWPVAIDTHTRNHPLARHVCEDIATVRPGLLVTEGYLDLLMASPSCTGHSVARGGKPTSDQQRSDPWHILTWLTELDVRQMIIENVWEFTKWGPLDPATGTPIKEKAGEYFDLWISVIRRLGYDPEWRKLNAANYGAATTRQRFILMAKKDRRQVSWPAASHGKGAALPWRAASEIINWTLKGRSIFNRPVPLAPKTLARVLAGIIKFGWPEIFVTLLLCELERSLKYQIGLNFARRHAAKAKVRERCRRRARGYAGWLRHHRAGHIAAPNSRKRGAGASPMLVTLRKHAHGRSIGLPIPTVAANGTHIAIAEPVFFNGRKNNQAKGVTSAPVPTLDTKGGVWLAEPFILNRHGDGYGEVRAHSTEAPMPTANCSGAGYLVEPFVLSQASGGAPRGTNNPLPTAVAGGAIAMICPYYGSGSGETCSTVEQPLPTATAKPRFGLVVPITHNDGSQRARDVEVSPLPTLTTAHRGELALVEGAEGDGDVQVDILFRMLQPPELAGATGFHRYEFAGNKTEQVKQIGNAVPPDLMDACVTAMMADHPAVTKMPAAAKPRRKRVA